MRGELRSSGGNVRVVECPSQSRGFPPAGSNRHQSRVPTFEAKDSEVAKSRVPPTDRSVETRRWMLTARSSSGSKIPSVADQALPHGSGGQRRTACCTEDGC